MGIEDSPYVKQLETYVQGLPKEHRAGAYRIAEASYDAGLEDEREDDITLQRNYFTRKITQAQRESQVKEETYRPGLLHSA